MNPLFPLGRTVATPGALETFPLEFISACLHRHVSGDWGDLDEEDKAANVSALRTEDRILSVYHQGKNKLYILTEADRSVTTALLPSEY